MEGQYPEGDRRGSGCAVAILIVTLISVIGIITVAAVGFFAYQAMEADGVLFEPGGPVGPFEEQPTLDVKLQAPGFVKLGDEFDIVLLIRNLEAQDPIELYSVDVDLDFLEGFEVLSIEPEPGGSEPLGEWYQKRWLFQTPVKPGESLRITFRLKAARVGHYVGDFDVCDPEVNYTTVRPNVDVVDDAKP